MDGLFSPNSSLNSLEIEIAAQKKIEDNIKLRDHLLQQIKERQSNYENIFSNKYPSDPLIKDYFKQSIEKIKILEKQIQEIDSGKIPNFETIRSLKTLLVSLQKNSPEEFNILTSDLDHIIKETNECMEKTIPKLISEYDEAIKENELLKNQLKRVQNK